VFATDVPSRHTRRHALGLGAAAVAGAALRPSPSLAAALRPSAFALDLAPQLARVRRSGGWLVLPAVRAPRRFDTVGLGFPPGGAAVEPEIRARRSGGRWTPWTALHGLGDHAPDGAPAPGGTGPCWTGSADELQVRVRRRPRRLEARFVRAIPAAAAARRLHARSARAGASAAGHEPRIIPRSAWGGDAYPPKAPPLYGIVELGLVHHTVGANGYRPRDSGAIVLGILRYHRDHNGWNDIGYNFLVDRYGQIFEGRAGGVDQPIVGAQAQGYNGFSTGIACLGDYESVSFPHAGFRALAHLLAWKLSLHGVPVHGHVTVTSTGGADNRYPSGRRVRLARISGHRDADATECPGARLYARLPQLRRRVAELTVPIDVVTLNLPSRVVRAPAPFELFGKLAFADGAAAGGLPVQIGFRPDGGSPAIVATATTAPDGSWSASVAPPAAASGAFTATFPGDAAHGPIDAPPAPVQVLPRLTLALSRRRARAGHGMRVSGSVQPFSPRHLRLRLVRLGRHGDHVVSRRRVPITDGRFQAYVRLRRHGRYRLTGHVPGATVRRILRAT
jgi:N-acetylmuramoyl-L-alanine amidase-like protein